MKGPKHQIALPRVLEGLGIKGLISLELSKQSYSSEPNYLVDFHVSGFVVADLG